MKKYGIGLEAVVFTAGICTMTLELVGSRILAPYLGTSITVWTSLIGVILACLSAGYWLGGRLADRSPKRRTLSLVLFWAGLATGITAVLADTFAAASMAAVRDIRWSSALATLILFGPASVFLGTVLPLAVRLRLERLDQSGRTVGTLYALSTLGSILGTFLTGFFLVAYLPCDKVILLVATVLMLLALMVHLDSWKGRKVLIPVVILVGLVQSAAFAGQLLKGPSLLDFNTRYNRIWIYDAHQAATGAPIRIMRVNNEHDSAMLLGSDELAFEYTNYFRLAGHFFPDFKKTLMIGGAAYSVPKDFLARYPGSRMDVAEIDPGVTALARKYFALKDDPLLKIFHEDARVFLNRNRTAYDTILVDAFKSYSVPYQLTTLEAVRRMHESLSPQGIVIMNIISSVEGPSGQFLRAEVATFKSCFPQVYLFGVRDPENGSMVQNLILVALRSPTVPRFYSRDPQLHAMLQHLWIKPIAEDLPPLTDSLAPTDRYMQQAASSLSDWKSNPVLERMHHTLIKDRRESSRRT
ncbi:MAG: fused MFS/spermidine synthase [Candidatus Omnitrophota bacterium]